MRYMEGHYLYLRCPTVENTSLAPLKEWHPFTISSCPDEAVLELNIRVSTSPHSWTNKMAQYLRLLDPGEKGQVELLTRNPSTGKVMPGKVFGPNGKPFFMIDGPYGAPSQHVFQYNTSILVGAGIGVTPCASILKGIVRYRWKKGFTPANMHFFWLARLSDIAAFRWLLVLLPELKAEQLQHNEYYSDEGMERSQLLERARVLQREVDSLESRLRVARAAGAKEGGVRVGRMSLPKGWVESVTEEGNPFYYNVSSGERSWTPPEGANDKDLLPQVAQLAEQSRLLVKLKEQLRQASIHHRTLSLTLYLTGCSPDDLEVQQESKPGSVAGLVNELLAFSDPVTGQPFIHLKAGRPKWDIEFAQIAETYKGDDIGVVFCGAPAIASALKETCAIHSTLGGTRFHLHKENF